MSNWIPLDPGNLNRIDRKDVGGIQISIGMSPYDLPEGVRGVYRKEIDRFVIEFKYLGLRPKEKLRPIAADVPNILFMVGVHSGRLYEIHVDVKSIGTDQVSITMLMPQVESSIRSLGQKFPSRADNFDVARDVITQKGNLLFEEPVGANE